MPTLLDALGLFRIANEMLALLQGRLNREVLKERVEFLRDQIAAYSECQAKNEADLREAKERVAQLEEELAKDFFSYGGALFHLLDGRLDCASFCPRCRVSTSPFWGFCCQHPGCGWQPAILQGNFRAAFEKVAAHKGVQLAEPLFDLDALDKQIQEGECEIHSRGGLPESRYW